MDLRALNKIVKSMNGGILRLQVPLNHCKLSSLGLMYFMSQLHAEYGCFPYSEVRKINFRTTTPESLINVYNKQVAASSGSIDADKAIQPT